MDHMKTGEVISKRRKELGLTQSQLAKSLHISFQAVSKWENGTAYPDIEMLPKLAATLNTTIDALFGYSSVVAGYDKRYNTEEYYWGLMPNHVCYDIMKILPPVKPYSVLDIGCGEGKDAVFFAKCGYTVTAFDISEQGIEKAKRLAEYNKVEVGFFKADIFDYRPDSEYDIIITNPGRSRVYGGRVCVNILKQTLRLTDCAGSPVQTGRTTGQAQKTNSPVVERHP